MMFCKLGIQPSEFKKLELDEIFILIEEALGEKKEEIPFEKVREVLK